MLRHILRLGAGTLCLTFFVVVVQSGAASLAAAEEDSPGLETKQIADDGSVRAEGTSQPAAKPAKLVPFPEDEEEPTGATSAHSAPAEKQPAEKAAASTPKSNFQPRFKPPAVRQVQHAEPADGVEEVEAETDAAEASADAGPELKTAPGKKPTAKAAAQASPGKGAVDEAFGKAKTAESEGDYTDVIDKCRQGTKAGLKPAYQEYARKLMGWAYNRRGELRAAAGQNEEALADFEAAVEAEQGKGWRAIHNRGVSYASLGRTREAMSDFDQALELNANYQNAYFNRGELKYEQADFAGAVADYSSAIKIGPPDASVFNGRGHAYYRLKKFGDALRDYSEAIKLDPASAAALINRGDAYADLGRYGEAAKDYRTALQVDAKLGRAYQAAAWLMATCPDEHYRNEKLAIDAARKAIELDGEDHRTLETLAAALANADKFDEARATQEKAIAKAPKEEFVTAEKRMALYQRELAFREQSPLRSNPIEDRAVRQASGTEPTRPAGPPERTARTAKQTPPQGRRQSMQGNRRPPQESPQAYQGDPQGVPQSPQRKPRSGWWPEPRPRN